MRNKMTLSNNVEEISLLCEFVEQSCEQMGFDTPMTMSINLALEEAIVNVMEYAYPPGTKGTVDILAETDNGYAQFTISDNGIAFDPTAKEDVDITLSAEERPIGGLGIHLIRHIMDDVTYERKDNKNILILRKQINK